MSDSAPGDQADEGTPGAGENVCPARGGNGLVDDAPCETCDGTGLVIEGIGGG
jgi:DnaJ-class molecular chaperone